MGVVLALKEKVTELEEIGIEVVAVVAAVPEQFAELKTEPEPSENARVTVVAVGGLTSLRKLSVRVTVAVLQVPATTVGVVVLNANLFNTAGIVGILNVALESPVETT